MSISKQEKLDQLEKVLRGRALHGSESLRAFLRFVVEKLVEGQESQLKEYAIATEVFGRGGDFDSRIDSVVRVQAGRLRTKLHEYYEAEGRDDRIIIDLPKGHYTPVFTLAPDIAASAALAESTPPPEETAPRFEGRDERPLIAPVWDRLLTPAEPLLVVFSNTIFHGTEEGMKIFNSLDIVERNGDSMTLAQGAGANAQAVQSPSEALPRVDHYTGIGEVMGVYFLSEFFAQARRSFRLKRSLLLTWDDAKIGNIIVLGSPAENWFLLDLPQKQDFVFRWVKDEQGRSVNAIVNTNPQPGEQDLYLARYFGPSPSQVAEDYAVVSLLQGLRGDNCLLILAGINTFGTQAAVEYVTRAECIRDLISRLNTAPAGESPRLSPHFQILLRVKVNGGVPVQISYVTHHVLNP